MEPPGTLARYWARALIDRERAGPVLRGCRRRITMGGGEDRSAGAGPAAGRPAGEGWRRKAVLAYLRARRGWRRAAATACRRPWAGWERCSRPAGAAAGGNPRPVHGRTDRRCRRRVPAPLSVRRWQRSAAGPADAPDPATARPAPLAPGRRAAGRMAGQGRKRSTGSSSHTGLITPHWRSATGHRR